MRRSRRSDRVGHRFGAVRDRVFRCRDCKPDGKRCRPRRAPSTERLAWEPMSCRRRAVRLRAGGRGLSHRCGVPACLGRARAAVGSGHRPQPGGLRLRRPTRRAHGPGAQPGAGPRAAGGPKRAGRTSLAARDLARAPRASSRPGLRPLKGELGLGHCAAPRRAGRGRGTMRTHLPGPPSSPSLPAVRRAVIAGLAAHITSRVQCPWCQHRFRPSDPKAPR